MDRVLLWQWEQLVSEEMLLTNLSGLNIEGGFDELAEKV